MRDGKGREAGEERKGGEIERKEGRRKEEERSIGATTTVDPTLDHAQGAHPWWIDRGSVDSKFAHGFAHMTGAAGIKSQTSGS